MLPHQAAAILNFFLHHIQGPALVRCQRAVWNLTPFSHNFSPHTHSTPADSQSLGFSPVLLNLPLPPLFFFVLHPSFSLSVSLSRTHRTHSGSLTLRPAPTVKIRRLLGNHSACCPRRRWMLGWRSRDCEVKAFSAPTNEVRAGGCWCVGRWGSGRGLVALRPEDGNYSRICKRLHMMSGGSPLGLNIVFIPSSRSFTLQRLFDTRLPQRKKIHLWPSQHCGPSFKASILYYIIFRSLIFHPGLRRRILARLIIHKTRQIARKQQFFALCLQPPQLQAYIFCSLNPLPNKRRSKISKHKREAHFKNTSCK